MVDSGESGGGAVGEKRRAADVAKHTLMLNTQIVVVFVLTRTLWPQRNGRKSVNDRNTESLRKFM